MYENIIMNGVKLFSGVKVLELPGLAPVPFCGQILADYGADVVYIEKVCFYFGIYNILYFFLSLIN